MKSNILNSKRVFLVLAGLAGLLYLPREMKITEPYVQAILITSEVFLILSAVLGISWSEKGLDAATSIVKSIANRDPPPQPPPAPTPPPQEPNAQ
jgi:hypothetical protein